MWGKIIVLRGPSATGKSEWARANHKNRAVVHDSQPAEFIAKRGGDVILDSDGQVHEEVILSLLRQGFDLRIINFPLPKRMGIE